MQGHQRLESKAARSATRPGGQRARPPESTTAEDLITSLQRSVGNQVVQRVLQRVSAGPHKDVSEDEAPIQRYVSLLVQRVTPTFPVDRPAPKRSNSDASITRVKGQSYTGDVVENKATNTYSYDLKSFESKGEIQLVYYTDDHYPAPTPEDDSGALSNVKKANWKTIADDLHANRTGIAGAWSAYRAEPLHEDYHWNTEWAGSLTPELNKAETKLKALKVPTSGATAQNDTKAQADTIVQDAIKTAKSNYAKLGDSPGDPPYIAQAPAIDALEKRVRDEATAQKW